MELEPRLKHKARGANSEGALQNAPAGCIFLGKQSRFLIEWWRGECALRYSYGFRFFGLPKQEHVSIICSRVWVLPGLGLKQPGLACGGIFLSQKCPAMWTYPEIDCRLEIRQFFAWSQYWGKNVGNDNESMDHPETDFGGPWLQAKSLCQSVVDPPTCRVFCFGKTDWRKSIHESPQPTLGPDRQYGLAQNNPSRNLSRHTLGPKLLSCQRGLRVPGPRFQVAEPERKSSCRPFAML